MSTTIARSFRFEAAHRLPNVPATHKCARLHGHSYTATVEVSGNVDPILGWVVDFAEIDASIAPMRSVLDHSFLNEIEGLSNPTSEILARWIYDRLLMSDARFRVTGVTVSETCTSSATYRGGPC